MTAIPARSEKIGLLLPVAEGMFDGHTPRWSDLLALARAADDAGFDSIWIIDHLLIPVGRWVPGAVSIGGWECWSLLAGLAAATNRLHLGTFMTCTAFRNPALLAKMAATVDEISGGRLVLGLGAGSVLPEFPAFGYPTDHPVGRFEEAVRIIRGLLRDGEIDFTGRYYQARACELRPRGPRPNGPPLMIGSRGPRMDHLAARYADSWNGSWHNRAEWLRPRLEAMEGACLAVGRDPASLELTAGIMIDLPRSGPTPDWPWGEVTKAPARPLTGSVEEIAAELRAYYRLGVDELQIYLDPCTVEGIAAFAPVLELLGRNRA